MPWNKRKVHWFVAYTLVTGCLCLVGYLYAREVWFPAPWHGLSLLSEWYSGIAVVAFLSGPGVMGLTVHPGKTTHWLRDFGCVFFLQMALVGSLGLAVESSRPVVAALVSGDWLFIQKSEHESHGPFQNVIVVPSQHTLSVGWKKDPASWKPITPTALQKASRWDVVALDKEWSKSESSKEWLDFKERHPEWKSLGFYPVYGMNRSGWWVWDLTRATPLALLSLAAPLDEARIHLK